MSEPLWIPEQDVVALMSLGEAIPALEAALREEAAGGAANMPKTLLQFGKSNLHALGARLDGLVGTKTWAHTEGGTCPLLLLWDAGNGGLVAVIEAFALGNMRTGGLSGLATKWMATADASVLGLIGTGKQAMSQAAAVLAVRPIKRIQVFSPRAESRAAFAVRARAEFGVEALDVPSTAAACRGAQVVTLITRAASPFLTAAMLERGVHVNAAGAIAPDREEFAQDVFDRASVVAVDNLSTVKTLSREFMTRYQCRGWDEVHALSALIAAGRRREPADDLSLFKAMGMGISDLALGAEIVKRARRAGAGRPLPQPQKAKPRLGGAQKETT